MTSDRIPARDRAGRFAHDRSRPTDGGDVDAPAAGVEAASTTDLWQHVRSASPVRRREAAASANLTLPQARELLEHDQPFEVREAAGVSFCPGVAAVAATDPDAAIRARALMYGWDLPDDVADGLCNDEGVRQFFELTTGREPAPAA